MSKRKSEPPKRRDGWWKDGRNCAVLSNYWQRHIVGLHVLSTQNGSLVSYVYTGFLLEFGPFDLWITAGHVIDELKQLTRDDRITVRSAEWVDGFPHPSASSIPGVDVSMLDCDRILDGYIDIGVVMLPELTVTQLKANPSVEFLTPTVWHRNDFADPIGFYVVGIPNEHQHVRTQAVAKGCAITDVAFPIVALPVERIEHPGASEDDEFWAYPDAFYGRLRPASLPQIGTVQSIVGMSGGPIISIERTPAGRLKYRVFAIQSEWCPDSRIVRATPIEVLDSALRAAFERAVASDPSVSEA